MGHRIHTSAGNGGADATGPGGTDNHPTDRFAVRGTDLGYLFTGGGGAWVGGVFGDTFDKPDPRGATPPGGDRWRSPVLGRSTTRDMTDRGIVWDSFAGAGDGAENNGGPDAGATAVAREIFPYRRVGDRGRLHSGTVDCFTLIPNDIVELPDGTYLGCGFRVRDWGQDATQGMCHTVSNAWFRSTDPDAGTWRVAEVDGRPGVPFEWGVEEPYGRYFQNASLLLLPGDDHLHVLGSREGRKLGHGDEADGVYLRRARWDRCLDPRAWEYYGVGGGLFSGGRDGRPRWGRRVRPVPVVTPLTQGGHIGELDVQYVAGTVVLTYVDVVAGAVALTAQRPEGPWSAPTVLVSREQSPALYAPSVHPWTTDLRDAYLHLSSWLSVPDPVTGELSTVNYCTEGWRVSLVPEDR